MATDRVASQGYRRGRRREYTVMERLRSWGATKVERSQLSRGPADILAWFEADGELPVVWAIQVHSGRYLSSEKGEALLRHCTEHDRVPVYAHFKTLPGRRATLLWYRRQIDPNGWWSWVGFTEPTA